MIEITYLDASKQERTMTFESYEEFERSQHACLIGVADYYPVQKLTYNGHVLDYQMCIRDRKERLSHSPVA